MKSDFHTSSVFKGARKAVIAKGAVNNFVAFAFHETSDKPCGKTPDRLSTLTACLEERRYISVKNTALLLHDCHASILCSIRTSITALSPATAERPLASLALRCG